MEAVHLDALIGIQALLQKANAADRAAGETEADMQFTNAVKHFASPEAFARHLEAQGISPTEFRTKALQEAIANAVLRRLVGASVTDEEAERYVRKLRLEEKVEILDPRLKALEEKQRDEAKR